MPWKVQKRGSGPKPFKIVKSDTGQVVGSSSTREAAQASVRARYRAEPVAAKKRRK